jgi:hypothetical protein
MSRRTFVTVHALLGGGLPSGSLLTERCHKRGRIDVLDTTLILPDVLVRAERCKGHAAELVWSVRRTALGGDGGRGAENRGDD